MATARPLRDIFTEVTGDVDARGGDPAELLRANGHTGLPEELVAEAVVTYADTAPIEVAEQLAPYVMAHTAVPTAAAETEASAWLNVLTTAPTTAVSTDPTDSIDELDQVADARVTSMADIAATTEEHGLDQPTSDLGFAFGLGGDPADLDAGTDPADLDASAAPTDPDAGDDLIPSGAVTPDRAEFTVDGTTPPDLDPATIESTMDDDTAGGTETTFGEGS